MVLEVMARAGFSRGSQLLEQWRGAATQAAACALLKIDEATYSRFKNGKRKPDAELCFRIERLTEGHVPAKSWFEPPLREAS